MLCDWVALDAARLASDAQYFGKRGLHADPAISLLSVDDLERSTRRCEIRRFAIWRVPSDGRHGQSRICSPNLLSEEHVTGQRLLPETSNATTKLPIQSVRYQAPCGETASA
jgi:hypothetical protein